jgi:N-acetylmuramoyl-L-alanine amidase
MLNRAWHCDKQLKRMKNLKFMKYQKSINLRFWMVVFSLAMCILYFCGCATVPTKTGFPSYNIGGVTYFALIPICDLKNIRCDYDTVTKNISLSKDMHTVNLRIGERLTVVDGCAQNFKYPPQLYNGAVVVSSYFKQEILDTLFRNLPAKTSHIMMIKKVVIDAGHGGKDPGAIGRRGLKEKIVSLDIALRLRQLLINDGVEVAMTRSSDVFIPLEKRVDIANKSGADLFISIHANANRVRSLKGFEVYYVSTTVDDSSRAANAANKANLNFSSSCISNPSSDLKAILWDMIYNYNRAESIELAGSICKTTQQNLDCKILGIKSARFHVLKGTRIPAILIEVGFVSNYSEERFLNNSYYRQRIAEAIRDGVEGYSEDLLSMRAN